MFELVLFEPRIPANTGNAIRLSANTGARLHLVEPLGFDMSEAKLRRAGLDYHDLADVTVHPDFAAVQREFEHRRWFATSAHAGVRFDTVDYRAGDVMVFGPEPTGLPDGILTQFPAENRLRVPMRPGSRSLNLANTIAVVVYEGWRQLGFPGAA